MIKQRMELLFWAHSPQKQSEYVTLYFRLTLAKVRVELGSTGIKVLRKHWNSEAQKITARTATAIQQNHTLEIYESKARAIYNELTLKNEPFSASYFKTLFQQNGRGYSFSQLFATYLLQLKNDPAISPATLEVYTVVSRKVSEFLQLRKQTDLYAENFGLGYMEQYKNYMRIELQRAPATIRKHCQFIKQVLTWGRLNEYISRDPLQGYRVQSVKPNDPVFLLPEDLLQLLEHEFKPHERVLSEIRDNFLISCFTGFAYADLKTFNSADIEMKIQKTAAGPEVLPWIQKNRRKTDKTAIQPLHPVVSHILALRYNGKPENLRIRPNQKTNFYLKVIGLRLHYKVELTTHVGRKTFANLCLNGGLFSPVFGQVVPEVLSFASRHFSTEATLTMLGRTSAKGLEAYVKVDERRIMEEMDHKPLKRSA